MRTNQPMKVKASHNNLTYTISKNDGVLRVSLQGNHKPNQDQEEIQENQETTQSNAIELYNFAKENEYRILKDSPSQMLDIKLKLQDNKELSTSHNGNFSLTINNLTLLDSKGENLDIASREDFTLYLHNCENRQVYTSTTITKNPNSDTYSTTFHFDLILEETSNLFKRTTKLIVATQNLANDFSTSEIHSKGNVAIISLSSADKKGGSYTFGKRVSAQEFGEGLAIQTTYVDNDENAMAYKTQIDRSKSGLVIETIKAYSDKEQTIQIDCLNLQESIFVRAILNDESRVFYDETIQWAYYLKGISENLDKIDTKKAYKMDNVEGNDILFCIDLLNKQDKDTLLNNPQNYKLMLFAYFHKPAIKIGNKTPHIVLSVESD